MLVQPHDLKYSTESYWLVVIIQLARCQVEMITMFNSLPALEAVSMDRSMAAQRMEPHEYLERGLSFMSAMLKRNSMACVLVYNASSLHIANCS